jgi:cytochrome-b5 reductase
LTIDDRTKISATIVIFSFASRTNMASTCDPLVNGDCPAAYKDDDINFGWMRLYYILASAEWPHQLIFCLCAAGLAFYATVYLYSLWDGPRKLLPLKDFIDVPLKDKKVLSHDTAKFTFALPTHRHILGLPTGQHITLQFTDATDNSVVQRSYTPVSDNSTLGEVSIVVKVYKPLPPKFPNGGKMSQHLDSLSIGDTIRLKGPKGHMEWEGSGHFTVKPLGKKLERRFATQIGMMAGGTGITPMLQVLHHIFRDKSDTITKVKMIYANQTEDDVLVRHELEALHLQFPHRFLLWYTVDRIDEAKQSNPEEAWEYDVGFIGTAMVEKRLLFEEREGTQFFMCGPPPMIKFACLPALQELGYAEKDWVVF